MAYRNASSNRYNHNGNLEGVGICCNNIGNIHLKNGRYSEAVSEYQESILMAKIEDKELQKQLNKIIEEEMPSYQQTYLDLKVRKQMAQEKISYRESYSNKFASDISNNYSDDNQKLLIENKDTSQKLADSQYYKLRANSNQRLMAIKKEQEELNKKLSGYNEDYGIQFNKRNQVKQNMINRKYQLAGALLMYGISEKQVNFLPQCVNLLKQCIKLSDIVELSQTKNQRSQTVRKICIYTKLAICNIKLQNIKEAQINIKKAKNEFDMINMQKENKQQELDLLKEAVEKLLESIQQPLNYDTNTRIETLKVMKNLYDIFMDNQQKKLQAADEINPFLDKFNLQSVDLIFLIEYSGKIKNEQLHTAQSIAKQVFDNLQNEDNLGLLIFNDCVHECFSLQNVKKYRDYLERKVRTIQKEPGQQIKKKIQFDYND
ncbi:hypothetical protein PPERSA_03831 [Pseudocohnilembus persalinus]|uniref:VWFA domain-containing protein n=1 Tax=Pseudocohnilembus persalinus TaxID=266149 RepID=A0A0V0QUS8_PSEPJ|nr:hypothetical protein PPERSA_03831 [Pseudocohnilembus persalinus]|eukprot:KRX05894.1 hypothetical protein PPERSA_03831 [Pseudocohnilembus persalinus]